MMLPVMNGFDTNITQAKVTMTATLGNHNWAKSCPKWHTGTCSILFAIHSEHCKSTSQVGVLPLHTSATVPPLARITEPDSQVHRALCIVWYITDTTEHELWWYGVWA
mmetsp:Transcript_12971/g.27849  ORF Transcript_12971/g.27849 Transcript_12971/m.27849 type:complete len:108 (-) Transcript_12971:396-719(-)